MADIFSCRTMFLRLEKAAPCVSSALCRGVVWNPFSPLMLESLMALNDPWLTFTGRGARTHFQSFRFRKYLAAIACKDEICRMLKSSAWHSLSSHALLLFCTSITVCEPLAACNLYLLNKRYRWNIHQEGWCFPQGSHGYGPWNGPPHPPLPTLTTRAP